ncbi:MAG: hypothetical protein HKN91_06885 [Acidimicrobiia bacterium]|nr:hypothetical protein [Acidimicrobiia bacterium]
MEQQATAKPATQGARLQELTQSVRDIEERVSGVGDSVAELNERAVEFIAEKPLAAIGIAFGVGYLIGKLATKRWLV